MNAVGKGRVFHLGSAFSQGMLRRIFDAAGLKSPFADLVEAPADVELVMREKDGERFVFALNYTAEEQILTLKKPVRSLTKGAPMAGKQVLAPYGVEVVDLKYHPRVIIREDALPNLALFRE